MALKGFEKFKSCRGEVNKNYLKRIKNIEIPLHYKLKNNNDREEE
jgi:hypothetical protein